MKTTVEMAKLYEAYRGNDAPDFNECVNQIIELMERETDEGKIVNGTGKLREKWCNAFNDNEVSFPTGQTWENALQLASTIVNADRDGISLAGKTLTVPGKESHLLLSEEDAAVDDAKQHGSCDAGQGSSVALGQARRKGASTGAGERMTVQQIVKTIWDEWIKLPIWDDERHTVYPGGFDAQIGLVTFSLGDGVYRHTTVHQMLADIDDGEHDASIPAGMCKGCGRDLTVKGVANG